MLHVIKDLDGTFRLLAPGRPFHQHTLTEEGMEDYVQHPGSLLKNGTDERLREIGVFRVEEPPIPELRFLDHYEFEQDGAKKVKVTAILKPVDVDARIEEMRRTINAARAAVAARGPTVTVSGQSIRVDYRNEDDISFLNSFAAEALNRVVVHPSSKATMSFIDADNQSRELTPREVLAMQEQVVDWKSRVWTTAADVKNTSVAKGQFVTRQQAWEEYRAALIDAGLPKDLPEEWEDLMKSGLPLRRSKKDTTDSPS